MDAGPRRARSAGVRPWFLWLTDLVPGSSLWVGLAVSAALICALLALPDRRFAPAGYSEQLGFQILLFFNVLTGLVLATMPWMERAALRDLASLRPAMRGSEAEFLALERSLTHFSARRLWAAILLGQGVNVLISSSSIGFAHAPRFEPQFVFAILIWLVLAPTTYVLLSQASLFQRVGADLRSIQLFDLRPLKAFSRVGLRTALFYSGFIAIGAVAHTDWSSEAIGIPTYILWIMFLLWTPVGLALALLPVWGVHRRIQAEKGAELDRVRAALDGVPDAFAASSMAAQAGALQGVALLDYREKVEGVREWPFDGSGFRRLALYLLIPPLGWLGGALVERGIDRALQ